MGDSLKQYGDIFNTLKSDHLQEPGLRTANPECLRVLVCRETKVARSSASTPPQTRVVMGIKPTQRSLQYTERHHRKIHDKDSKIESRLIYFW